MIETIKKYFDQDRKELQEMKQIVTKINDEQHKLSDLTDEEISLKTKEFKTRINEGENLDDLLPEAFAVVKETAKRTIGIEHYDVQLLGGIVLHQGNIAEMKTGEGKTLVATLPAYLNALKGDSVHIYTVNDYLANRDMEWMKPIYNFLGLSTGCVLTSSTIEERLKAYKSDIVYGTSNEFGFDYLRSNLVKDKEFILLDKFNYAIVDEVDTILIDEARVPLTLSGLSNGEDDEYNIYPKLIEELVEDEDFELNQEQLKTNLTEVGINKVEKLFEIDNLYSSEHIMKVHRINHALIVKYFMKEGRDYIIQDNKVVMIDSFTGRLMPGRRFADGVQQSIEAKEGLPISPEYIIRGSITYQNLLRKYSKVSGMSGTAKTEESEFQDSYGMHVYEIPTNRELKRVDYHDVIYKTKNAKYKAIIKDIIEINKENRPVLVGTESVEESQIISGLLDKENLPHYVLNAKNHEKEAELIKCAGDKNRITIITNMAGRGTDVKINEEVNQIGGLHVIGTTRHENRRIDNQLRGRSGRQGDSGTTQIFVSLEDELVKRYGGDQVRIVLNKINISEDLPIENSIASKLVEQMQIQSEASASNIRRFVKQYDDILNDQRNVLYDSRKNVLFATHEEIKEHLFIMYKDVIEEIVLTYCEDEDLPEEWDLKSTAGSSNRFLFTEDSIKVEEISNFTQREEISEFIVERMREVYNRKEKGVGEERLAEIVRSILLTITDSNWIEHMATMDYLRQGLGIRGTVGNPLLEFSVESHDLFDDTIHTIKEMATLNTVKLEIHFKEKE